MSKLAILLPALLLLCGAAGLAAGAERSAIVYPGGDGRLIYAPDAQGNIIPDFSHCGYMGGGVALPELAVRATLDPSPGTTDDTARIQAQLDAVGQLAPDANGHRGAVLLRRGTYHVSGSLTINRSGVVLRGEGMDEDGTIIIATATSKQTVVRVAGTSNRAEVAGSRRSITTPYVPVGARTLTVNDASPFNVGDPVIVHRPSTAEWIHEIKMDQIPEITGTVQWAPGEYDLLFERRVIAKSGNTLTLDVPMVNSLEQQYGGGHVYKYTFAGRIEQAGVEDIRFVSRYDATKQSYYDRSYVSYTYPDDLDHGWTAVNMSSVQDGWVRRVSAWHFGMHLVTVGSTARRITIQDCAFLDAVSPIMGGYRYPFNLAGQQTLVMRCYARTGRHCFVMGSRVPGPNAFVDCKSELAYATTEPHHRWAAGTLYDFVSTDGPGAGLCALNRGNNGTGHGWIGAQTVFWNCRAPMFVLMKPPTAQNYAIGVHGLIPNDTAEFLDNLAGRLSLTNSKNMHPVDFTYDGTPFIGDAHFEHPTRQVEPRSLYFKQLADRLGMAAVLNVATPPQLDGSILSTLGGYPTTDISRLDPVVIYRETWAGKSADHIRDLSGHGWHENSGTTAAATTIFAIGRETSQPSNLRNVNNTQPSGTSLGVGLLRSLTEPINRSYMLWTGEITIDRTRHLPRRIVWRQRHDAAIPVRVAVRVGTVWFASNQTFTSTGTTYNQEALDWEGAAWRTLNFVPGSTLTLGPAVTLPADGPITGLGFYLDAHPARARFDTLEFEAGSAPTAARSAVPRSRWRELF